MRDGSCWTSLWEKWRVAAGCVHSAVSIRLCLFRRYERPDGSGMAGRTRSPLISRAAHAGTAGAVPLSIGDAASGDAGGGAGRAKVLLPLPGRGGGDPVPVELEVEALLDAQFRAVVLMQLAERVAPVWGVPAVHPALTPREVEVLALVAQGHPDRRVARRLDISRGAASKHVGNLRGKLGLHNRVELARWACGTASPTGRQPGRLIHPWPDVASGLNAPVPMHRSCSVRTSGGFSFQLLRAMVWDLPNSIRGSCLPRT
ncbi:helix-turn-helix transcriptional regulator (plasmid) [Deinococcus sp. D7000]|nr:helix-turn-helix transcriptional regulator [Deinococcus sp. D7000]